jgi:hypothetical protein
MAQSTNSVLLVEGANDKHVIYALCEHYKLPETFDVDTPKESGATADGSPKLLEIFPIHLKGDKQAVGIVLDGDENMEQHWRQVKRVIEGTGMGYDLPESPVPEGTIIEPTAVYQPRIGVWLMPDNRSVGRLEDFVRFLIPKGDELVSVAKDVLDQIKVAPGQRWSDHHDSKAFIHTWLAWQKVPGMPMGLAITAKALQADSPRARSFADWLRRLFTP